MTSLQSMIATFLFLAAAGCTAGEAAAPERRPGTGEGRSETATGAPVLVELFTSQGCSSCPPADRVLSELGNGDGIIPLAFHVDYWNSLGWQDPFSSSLWSTRQRDYAQVLPGGRVYTPQAVIQGRQHCVGSRRSCVDEAVAAIRAQPATARLEGALEEVGDDLLTVALAATSTTAEPLEAFVVLVEDALVTEVSRGENARRTLRNDHVVRRVARAFSLDGPRENGAVTAGTVSLELDPSWNRRNLGLVALLQNPRTREIRAVTRIPARL